MNLTAAPGALPRGERVYAVGDIHGCRDQLVALHALIAKDFARRPVASARLIHLGDYIDRGPDSAGVVALLAAGPPVPGISTVNLIGNHEDTLLAALAGDGAALTDWLHNGGKTALASWGVSSAAQSRWRDALPPDHVGFLRALAIQHRVGEYLFVHAGVRPGIPLARQSRDDLLMIRQVFLDSAADFGAIVVHGHTPARAPVVRSNRIGIDTGAVFGGALTCVVLEDDRIGFLQA